MSYILSNCEALENIELSNFNTENVIDMSYMFYRCHSLKNINLSNFNTENVENMSFMFIGCSSLTTIVTKDERIIHALNGCKIF